MDPASALLKARAHCAKQERCRSELVQKLVAWCVEEGAFSALLERLENEGFLNERRYAEHFAVSKLRQNGWGRLKIRAALEEKGVGEADIDAGLEGIDPGEYAQVLAKFAARRGQGPGTSAYLSGRGFEEDLIEEALRR